MKNKSEALTVLWVTLIPLLLLVIKISSPGLHYDEVLFVNSAHGMVDPTAFVTARLGPVPLLLMPYIGAIKAWLYIPIFKLFGVSVMSIRLPMIFLYVLSLPFLYFTLRPILKSKLVSLCILFLVAIDASILMHTRYDFGPVVIQFICAILSLYLLLRFVGKQELWSLITLMMVLFIGTYNKLNFIWFTNALVVVAIAVYGRKVWSTVDSKVKKKYMMAILCLGYLVSIAYYIFISIAYKLSAQVSFQASLSNLEELPKRLSDLLSGAWFYSSVIGDFNPRWSSVYGLTVLAVTIAAMVILAKQKKPHLSKGVDSFYIFCLALQILIVAQFIISAQAVGSWHFLMLQPFLTITTVLSVYIIYLATKRRLSGEIWEKPLTAIVLIVFLASAILQLGMYSKFINNISGVLQNKAWSAKIYDLVRYTESQNKQFVILDWGIHQQLISLDAQSGKYHEGLPNIAEASGNNTINQIKALDLDKTEFILHGRQTTYDQVVRTAFFSAIARNNMQAIKVRDVTDQDGTVVFQVYRIEKRPT